MALPKIIIKYTANRRRRIGYAYAILTFGLLLGLLGLIHVVNAHAYPVKSIPANGDALTSAPQSVAIWFSEMVAIDQSDIEVFDANFNQVDLKDSHLATQDMSQMMVSLPGTLPNGTYTVRWSAVSSMDDHHTSGAFVFAIGGAVSANMVATTLQSDTPIDPLMTGLDWLDTLTLTTLAGVILIGFLVLRPAVTPERFPVARVQRLIYGLAALSLLSAVGGLFANQLQMNDLSTILKNQLWFTALVTTRYGAIWWVRIALTIGLIGWARFWDTGIPQRTRHRRAWLVGSGMAGGLLLTLSLNSHSAGALWSGLSIAVDWAHLLAVSAWVGGLITLTAVLPMLMPAERWLIMHRYSALATICVVGITLTGFYTAALHLYRVEDLWQSGYGRWLCIKLLIVAAMLLLGLNNNRVLRPKTLTTPDAAMKTIRQRVLIESVLGVGALVVVGILASIGPPAPPPLTADRTLTQLRSEGDLTTALRISPNVPGKNTYALHVIQNNQPLSTISRARIRFILPDRDVQTPWVTLTATNDGKNTYSAAGLDLSAVGDWQAQIDVRPTADSDDIRFVFPWRIDSAQVGIDPNQPRQANIVALGLIGVVLMVVAWPRLLNALRGQYGIRLEQILIGAIAATLIVTIAATLGNSAVQSAHNQDLPTINPIPADTASILRGQTTYQQVCAACHGAQGLGDGVKAASLAVQPANLRVHVPLHTDVELYQYITQGFGAMPAVAAGMTADQRWDVINYLRSIEADLQSTSP
jgi:copper transport protein